MDNDKLLNITELELEIASLQSKIKLYEIRITRLKLSITKLNPTKIDTPIIFSSPIASSGKLT
jgi:hypothetical protein